MSPGEWHDLRAEAEELGYSSLQVPDHFSEQCEPLVSLAVAAECTRKLRLGTNVLNKRFPAPGCPREEDCHAA
jgi:alkanesulfonate monooxygenase SsuD/methylene tetrahydromethanopterin reductase-like flavin-dependent oxidoreductase (luciferase family)